MAYFYHASTCFESLLSEFLIILWDVNLTRSFILKANTDAYLYENAYLTQFFNNSYWLLPGYGKLHYYLVQIRFCFTPSVGGLTICPNNAELCHVLLWPLQGHAELAQSLWNVLVLFAYPLLACVQAWEENFLGNCCSFSLDPGKPEDITELKIPTLIPKPRTDHCRFVNMK